MIIKPYKSACLAHVTQEFGANPCSYQPKGHTGVDFYFKGCYGEFLVAPEKCKIAKVITDETIDNDYYPAFKKGYGVLMKSVANNKITYLYWHVLQAIPVAVGDTVKAGQVVAQLGNSGYCMSGGIEVPLAYRGTKGSHLHYEKRINNVCVNVLPDIDFNSTVRFDTVTEVSRIVKKMIYLLQGKK